MWIAAQMGHVGIVRELMDAGACVDTVREVRIDSSDTPRVRKTRVLNHKTQPSGF